MKGTSYFIDTNIFLRIIARDDLNKARDCEALILLIMQKKLKAFTSSTVLAEVVWTALSFYKLEKADTSALLSGLLGINNLKIRDVTNPLLALEYYQKHNVKFIDCLIASSPAIATGKAAVVSYDKDFDTLSVKRVEPAQLVK